MARPGPLIVGIEKDQGTDGLGVVALAHRRKRGREESRSEQRRGGHCGQRIEAEAGAGGGGVRKKFVCASSAAEPPSRGARVPQLLRALPSAALTI